MKQFLVDKCIPVLELPHPLHNSLYIAPCELYLFPKVKSVLKGTNFQSFDEVKSKMACMLNRVSADDLQHCLEQWNICMQWCVDWEGGGREYVEEDRN
jgi:hypothetical protein